MPLFHKDHFLPEWLPLPSGEAALDYSRHALEEAEFDRVANLLGYLPSSFNFSEAKPVEVTTDNRLRYERGLYRIPATKEFDLCLVVCRPEGRKARVASVWANKTQDTHRTLRKERYVPPPVQIEG